MEKFLLSLYYFFKIRRTAFWSVFLSLLVLFGIGASQVEIEEDITRFFPDDERVEKLDYVFRNSKFAERLVFMVSVNDSSVAPQPDSLVVFTEELIGAINGALKPYISEMSSQVDDTKVLELINGIQNNLPLFLEENDYEALDSLIAPENVSATLNVNYRQMVSPSGMITKKIISNDPLGFSFLVLKKLRQLQYDKSIDVYDNYLISHDHRHLIFFIEPLYHANETAKNAPFIRGLDNIIQGASKKHPQLKASYFGGTAVAVGNARQLQRDTMLTISLMVVLLAVFLISFFRRKRVLFLILIPVLFGGLFSLCMVYLLQGSISVIAIAAGSIILGIAVNYSLHFLVHLKHTNDVPGTIKDLVKPMTLGSATTVLAFLCLQFVNAEVLRDVGLFAAFSLVGAALCSLIFLPQLLMPRLSIGLQGKQSWIEKISNTRFESKKYLVWIILFCTPLFFFFAQRVSFNTDLSQLNFMNSDLQEAQRRLESINQASLSAVYVVSQAASLDKALVKNEKTVSTLQRLQEEGFIQKYSSVSSFIISDSLQKMKIYRWHQFWDKNKIANLNNVVRSAGEPLKFSETVYRNFEFMLSKDYKPADTSLWNSFRRAFFDDLIIDKNGLITVITLANVSPSSKEHVFQQVRHTSSYALDRQMITNIFAEYVHADFNFIVTFTAILVFIALLISYGRIELTLITFVPMLITWVWILGIMALAGIEFNIVNVMISTFIFGLGDDYSIFVMDGLQQEHISARRNLPSIHSSIFLSALTTITGLGVLIFAEHPALKSIAGISIIGIICVFIMSQTVEPFLFRWLITNRTSKGQAPMTLWGIFRTFYLYTFFILGSFVLTMLGLFLKLVPVARKRIRLFFHRMISIYTWTLIFIDPKIKVKIVGRNASTFSRPVVIICNHSSFLDILFTTMLHPRVILLTNKWVWNSPIFGGVVRLADYYPVTEGGTGSIDKLRDRVLDGYSIVVFPEGTRSIDGVIKRFHKGAFFIAGYLNLPVQPLLIHGAGATIPKSQFYINGGFVTLKFLPPIEPDDLAFGNTYSERTKNISRYFREQYSQLAYEETTPEHVAPRVITNYLFKGPVLEWYMRVKLKLERNYEPFHKLIPHKANILDLGCGYGFLSYMLAFLSDAREVTGVDYDNEKIAVANNAYSKTDRIHFFHADITQFPVGGYDVIVMADVLHYLTPAAQEAVLLSCFNALTAGGKLIIREGNADLSQRHQGTRLSEFFSVKLFKFNKATNDLHFLSGERLARLVNTHGLMMAVVDDTKLTSNIIFVISRPS